MIVAERELLDALTDAANGLERAMGLFFEFHHFDSAEEMKERCLRARDIVKSRAFSFDSEVPTA